MHFFSFPLNTISLPITFSVYPEIVYYLHRVPNYQSGRLEKYFTLFCIIQTRLVYLNLRTVTVIVLNSLQFRNISKYHKLISRYIYIRNICSDSLENGFQVSHFHLFTYSPPPIFVKDYRSWRLIHFQLGLD